MKSMNSHLEGPPHRLNASDSRQASNIDGISYFNCKAANNSKTAQDDKHDQTRRCLEFDGLQACDIGRFGNARERLLYIVLNNFITKKVVPVPGSEADYSAQPQKHNPRKRKPGEVRYKGDPRFVLPLMYVGNIYETLVNEVDVRLAHLDGYSGETIGMDLDSPYGLYRELAVMYPEKGLYAFKRRELATLGETRTKFPELLVQAEKGVRLMVVNGLEIVEKPNTMLNFNAEWFKRVTGRREVSISSQDYKFYSPRHKHQVFVGEAFATNSVAKMNVQTKIPSVPKSPPINNERLLKEDLGGRTVLQQFLSQPWAAKGFYYQRHREAPGTDGLSSDLVFAHTKSLALLRAFPYVLIVEVLTTSHVDRVNIPFFEVRGVASTWKSFNVACAFVAAEREDNYVWALNHIKDMCWLAGKTPTTIVTVTDPDQALFNAVEQVFPDSEHLLCRQHIYKIIKDRCLKDPCTTSFLSACKALFESKTEKVYEERLAFLENDCQSKQELFAYLKQTWLTPYKEKLVSAWTDKAMHFGTHDTAPYPLGYKQGPMRFPGLSLVKDSLDFRFGDVWNHLHSLLSSHTEGLNETFQWSQRGLRDIVPRVDLFRLLQHGISHKAMEIMLQEYKLATSGDKCPSTCVCQLRVTHGLPCAHEMAKYVSDQRPIPRDAIHQFWRQINLDVVPDEPRSDAAERSSLIDLLVELPYVSASGRRAFKQIVIERMRQGKPTPANLLSSAPLDSSSSETSGSGQSGSSSSEASGSGSEAGSPTSSGQRRGPVQSIERPKSRNKPDVEEPYIHIIPKFMVPYVMDFCEYADNGHCGFEAIAADGLMNGWRLVREDLFKDLATNSYLYENILVSHTVETMLKALAVWTKPAYLPEQRLSIPDMGHIVASFYQLVFVVLGPPQQCVTFLPLYVRDLSNVDELCLVSLQQGRKFIKVTMDKGFPLPPAHPSWARHHLRSANGLDWHYRDRFQKYKWFQSFMDPSFLDLKL